MPPQGSSLWGSINTCVEIALDIYYLCGEHGEGIVMEGKKAGQVLSDKALEAGREDGGFFYYGRDDTMDIPMYEILKKRLELNQKQEGYIRRQMEEIKEHGQISLTGYFGECMPPEGESSTLDKVRNGIYFVTEGDKTWLAVHENVVNNFLSPGACGFGEDRGSYLYFGMDTCAIPLYELKGIYRECQDRIISEDSLISTLCSCYPSYREGFNRMVPEEERIPQMYTPTHLFLEQQLSGRGPGGMENNIREEDMDYGESVDYGVEP